VKHLISLIGLVALTAACGDDTGSTGTGSGGDAAGSGGSSSEGSGGAPGTTTSGATTTTAATTTASSSTGEGAGPGAGGSGGEGTGGGGTGGGQTADGPQGDVLISVLRPTSDSLGTNLVATFDAAPRCEVLDVSGACVLSRCEFPGEPLDAGTLAIDGGDLPAILEHPYEEYPDDALVSAGDVVTVSSEGGDDVPAFELSATFPEHLTVTDPAFDGGTLSSADDLEVAWTGDGDDVVAVLVTGGADLDDPDFDEITCEVAMTDGEVVVPSELLAQMETTGSVFLSVQERATDAVEVDDWSIRLGLTRYADAENGIAGDAFQSYDLE
jgi:hypothetical protein